MAARHNHSGIFDQKTDCWHQTHVGTFKGGHTSLLLSPGAENPSYATDTEIRNSCDSASLQSHITVSTVVLNCCKGNKPSQWETPVFGPL